MNFCIHCGMKLESNQRFCIHCGQERETTIEQNTTPVYTHTTPRSNTPPPQQRTRKPMTKQKKIVIWTIAIILCGLFAAHQFLENYYDPMKSFQALDEAIITNNYENFIDSLTFEENAIIDEESYFKYIKEMEWEHIKEQATPILKTSLETSQSISSYQGNELFILEQKDVLFGLYSKISWRAVPTELHVATNLDDTEITINDFNTVIQANNLTKIESIYPGSYEISGNSTSQFGEFALEIPIEIETDILEVSLEFPAVFYTINTNLPESTLLINNKHSGITLDHSQQLGPFPESSAVTLQAESTNANGERITSNVVSLDDYPNGGEILLLFENSDLDVASETEEVEEEEQDEQEEEQEQEAETVEEADKEVDHTLAGDQVLRFRERYEQALNEVNFSLIEPFLQPNSQIYKDLKQYIADLKGSSFHFDFETNEVLAIKVVNEDTIEVTTRETFTFTNHLNQEIYYDREKVYTVHYTGDKYLLVDVKYVETNRSSD